MLRNKQTQRSNFSHHGKGKGEKAAKLQSHTNKKGPWFQGWMEGLGTPPEGRPPEKLGEM